MVENNPQVLTREDLRNELQNYATREDLRNELQNYATKDDLHSELRHYATKEDLAQMETRLVKWMVGLMLGAAGVGSTVTLVIQRLAG